MTNEATGPPSKGTGLFDALAAAEGERGAAWKSAKSSSASTAEGADRSDLFAAGAAATGAEKSSSSRPSKSGTGSGAFVFAGGAGVIGVVADRRGAGDEAERLPEIEFDLRAATTSSSPASYSSNVFLEDESLKPPLPPE